MSLRDRPSRGSSTGRTAKTTLTRALARVQDHVRTWPRRYVEMRTAAVRER
ncbi:hypothetical protein [Halosimplex pelagicum]|uniref:Uncharacterized protein n=1 Tax=Halosimplex pelagicum TaxID=869886 RepID=A0A7D5P6Y1_9EURY|nr:hypothetical protein [Halosimplex pelagicum]QLH80701.1 hypothetical protein HZS54_03205 [Halosimplex pelagicum]